jgi:O-antigen/teichoic acid export membrane protein
MYSVRRELFNRDTGIIQGKEIYRFMVPAFLATVLPTMIITLDQILVKHFFPSAMAGQYAAAGMIGKMIWFGSGYFAAPLFPKIIDLAAKGKDASHLLVKSLAYTGALVIVGVSAYFVMPYFIVNMLYGQEYLAIAPWIGLFGLSMGLFALSIVLINYNLASGRYMFIYLLIFSVLAEAIGIWVFHSSITDVIKIFFASNLMMFSSMLIYSRKDLGVDFG